MVKSIRFWIAVVLLAVLACCIMIKYSKPPVKHSAFERYQTSGSSVPASATETVPDESVHETGVRERPEKTENIPVSVSEPDAAVPVITEQKVNEITKRMYEVSHYSSDLIGWIYIADSDIDYPIVQGTDDQYYLHHAPDGRYHQLGTIFLSYQCTADFSDALNILYGHNTGNGMFSDIRTFKQWEQFDKHRYGWLFTKENLYRIDFFALSIVSAYNAIYDIPADSSEWQEFLKANSLYYIDPELNDDDSVVALSTCTSDFENSRALLAGKLIWKQKIHSGQRRK